MLQTQTVYPETLGVLNRLMDEPLLANFYLVGGTALSLQIGHRISVDIDLFTNEIFDSLHLAGELKEKYDFVETLNKGYFLQGQIKGIKIDILKYPYKPSKPVIEIDGIRMVERIDIATMKLAAITNRGRKRDFIDLYFLLKEFSLVDLITDYQKKYQTETFMLLQSLVYFDDSDNDIDQNMIIPIDWELIKTTIRKETSTVIKKIFHNS